MRAPTQPRLEDEQIAAACDALSNPVRVALLRELLAPKTLGEIRVGAPEDGGAGAGSIARQGIRRHLDRLLAVRMVSQHQREASTQYVMNQKAVFALAEQVFAFAGLRPEVELLAATERLQDPPRPIVREPGLLIAHGVGIGRLIPLPAQESAWTIGRQRGAEIALDFDPFVSVAHAVLTRSGSRYFLRDCGSRNGTWINFRQLTPDLDVPLYHGDLLSIGRTILVLRTTDPRQE